MGPIGGDDLTDAELAYLESGGAATEGLVSEEPPQPDPQGGQEAQPPQEPQDQSQPPEGGDDDDGEGFEIDEIVLDKNGRLRGKNGRFVPHAALHKEREAHKLTKAERDELREKLARGDERLKILNEAFNGQQPQSPQQQQQPDPLSEEPIDPSVDFMGAVAQIQRQQAAIRDIVQRSTETQRYQQQLTSLQQAYHGDVRRFMEQEPSFADAYRHLVGVRQRELELLGIADEADRNRIIAREEIELVSQALRSRRSPAELLYAMAKARGFQPAQQQQQPQAPGSHPQNDPAAAARDKLQQIRNGKAAADTLSGAGGAEAGLTFAKLAAMSDDEFAAVVEKMPKAQLERLLGKV